MKKSYLLLLSAVPAQQVDDLQTRAADGTVLTTGSMSTVFPGVALGPAIITSQATNMKKGTGARSVAYFFDAVSATHNYVFAVDSLDDAQTVGCTLAGVFTPLTILTSGAEIVAPKAAVTQWLSGLSSAQLV